MKNKLSQLIDVFHERDLPDPVLRAKVFPQIKGKADVVIGMRRAGKTWFCYQKIIELLKAGIRKNQILFLNFEDDRLLEFAVGHFQEILDVYYAKYPENKNTKCYFFFDEIQRIDQWEVSIRRLLDTENVQIYITGSSSKLFAEKPVSFGDKTASILRNAVATYFDKGGFPEVQGIDDHVRIDILQGYIDTVLLKDIIERHRVSNFIAIKYLVRSLMISSGQKFSINKFYNTMKTMSVKCTKNSLYEYLDHLVDAFLFSKVPVHSRSEKIRQLNPAKIYTIDTGLFNAVTFRNSSDSGLLEDV